MKKELKQEQKEELIGLLDTEIKEYAEKKRIPLNSSDYYETYKTMEKVHLDQKLLQQLLEDILQKKTYLLKFIDLSEVSFYRLNVMNKDLSGTNANIEPKYVYDKSIKNTNLKGINLEGKSFYGVEICGANLEDTDAQIDPQEVKNKSLNGTKLKGINLAGKSFYDIEICGADLEDTDAQIDPQHVIDHDLSYANLRNLDMCGKDFTDACITGTNLENTNAEIVLDDLGDDDLCSTNMNGCKIYYGKKSLNDFMTDEKTKYDKATVMPNYFEQSKMMIKNSFQKLYK